MTFTQLWMSQFTLSQLLELFLRVVVSGCCGVVIGSERTRRLKAAGIRTHAIVCCTAALCMIVSKYAFADLVVNQMGSRGADSARIAAQAVSGISFLCAGVIFKNENHVSGLTTAASLWWTTAVGLTLGAGMYVIGIPAAVLLVLFQTFMHHFTFGKDSLYIYSVILRAREPFDLSALEPLCQTVRAQILENSVRFDQEGVTTYHLTLRSRDALTPQQWRPLLDPDRHSGILSLEYRIAG